MKKFKNIREEVATYIKGRFSGETHEILLNPSPREIARAKIKSLGIIITRHKDAIVFDGMKLLHKEVEKATEEYGENMASLRGTWDGGFIETLHFSEILDDRYKDRAFNKAQNSPWLRKYSLIGDMDIEDM